MTRELVLVHGRSQEQKDSIALKREWLDALREGLVKSGLQLRVTVVSSHVYLIPVKRSGDAKPVENTLLSTRAGLVA